MESGYYNNMISVSIAAFIIVSCLITAYLAQKHIFGKKKHRTKDALNNQNNS